MNVAIGIFHSMYFRYRLIGTEALTRTRVKLNLLITTILPIILAITPYIAPLRFDTVMEVAIREHPDHNLEEYGPFGGFSSTSDPVFVINSLILYAVPFFLPIVIMYWKHLILKAFNSHGGGFTDKTRSSSRLLLKALTVQALMPLVCIVPIGLLYFVVQFTGQELVALEYLFAVFVTLPFIIDPICTIYFVVPYRKWIIEQCRGHIRSAWIDHNVAADAPISLTVARVTDVG
ncbi:hypothetical protein NECAME_14056 [Necator americanus]|uniref:G protein-coupled receptor n=1 Tax=Necator americanus TaxID=51031 RepID=W2SSV0_NECAM|nr:hypothetical protein NECAME_14056 [Necator americanus]ETN71926.1 hypothetical protein NECAME_14056 [Necator americanus]